MSTDASESKQNDTTNTSSDLMTKIRNILNNVTDQETFLQEKTSHIEKWYNMHKSALQNAQNIKKKLQEFEPINEETDNEETKQLKTENKNIINLSLDNLTDELKLLQQSETQYRSNESKDEIKIQTETINKLQNKNNILIRHNKSLLEENNNYEQKIKLSQEQHDILLETTKKDLFDRHKDYVENLQYQHEGQLKSLKIQQENQISYEIAKLTKDKQLELDKKLNELSLHKNIEFERERDDLHNEIALLKDKNNALETDNDEKNELLTRYVELDKEHQQTTIQWNNEKIKLNTEINEMKESGMKTAETLLELKNENSELQSNAAKHTLVSIKHSEEMDKLNLYIMELETLKDSNNKKIKILIEKLEVLTNQNNIIKKEKLALIKEVKKLRQNIIEKDAKKSEILSKMSENEMRYKEEIEVLNKEILVSKAQHSNVINRFEELMKSLSDCNSHIENFSDTINNFSVNGLMDSYETELEARYKSSELLNDTISNNINNEFIKLHKNINYNKLKDELVEIETNEKKIRTLFDESDIQIKYIRLAVLKLLMEYIESIKKCNDMYIGYNKPKIENENDGVYNYVSSGVSAVATMVNPFAWKGNQNDMDLINIENVKNMKKQMIEKENENKNKNDNENKNENEYKNENESENENENKKEDIINEDDDEEHFDTISTHYLAKSEFLSVSETVKVNERINDNNDAIQVNNDNQQNAVIKIENHNVTI